MKTAARAGKPRRRSLQKFVVAAARKGGSFAARRPFLVLGKMRRLAAWRQARGISIDPRNWARVVAAELAEVSPANLAHWCRWIGLGELPTGLASDLADAELQRRRAKEYRGRHGLPFPAGILGELLDLVTVERDETRFWLAIAIDETRKAGQKRRKAARVESEAEVKKRRAKSRVTSSAS